MILSHSSTKRKAKSFSLERPAKNGVSFNYLCPSDKGKLTVEEGLEYISGLSAEQIEILVQNQQSLNGKNAGQDVVTITQAACIAYAEGLAATNNSSNISFDRALEIATKAFQISESTFGRNNKLSATDVARLLLANEYGIDTFIYDDSKYTPEIKNQILNQ